MIEYIKQTAQYQAIEQMKYRRNTRIRINNIGFILQPLHQIQLKSKLLIMIIVLTL